MEPRRLQSRVARLFPGAGARRTRVAVEHELVASWTGGSGSVPISVVRDAAQGSYVGHLGFEPGGQVELSLPCAGGPEELGIRLRGDVAALREDLSRVGVRVDAVPVDPRSEDVVPLQLTSPRYVAMQAHFDRIGPAGRRMMRRTASTQVCLDWWPGRDGLEQWRVLNLAAPFLAAAFARGCGERGRLATWLEVDPSRTAFDGRLLVGDDPVAAYAAFAAGATVFTARGDVDEHLSTLFPPVRPRGRYLEVRFPDVQDEGDVERLVAAIAALVYDGERRHRWLRRLEPERVDLAEVWRAAAAGDPAIAAQGREIAGVPGLEAVA